MTQIKFVPVIEYGSGAYNTDASTLGTIRHRSKASLAKPSTASALNGEWCVQCKALKRDQPDDSRMSDASYNSTTSDNLLVSVEPSMTTVIISTDQHQSVKPKLSGRARVWNKKGKAQQQQQTRVEAVASAPTSASQSPQIKHKTIAGIDGTRTNVITSGDPHRLLKTNLTPHHTLPVASPSPTLIHQHPSENSQTTHRRSAPPVENRHLFQ